MFEGRCRVRKSEWKRIIVRARLPHERAKVGLGLLRLSIRLDRSIVIYMGNVRPTNPVCFEDGSCYHLTGYNPAFQTS
ncbi:MAG: hypothetical protein A4E62_01091 [Syntrophorhabdus sp. PtaU1.Bin002]|nr:MAG: hypothetical protein A4E58_03155 [Syntrophorhabdus sp. PtaB.Bin006]OPY71900.1 MAG: hypothetical protein A4E62_01091 [Syntrophorhabdus sp. PtaU1.Bin002]